MASLNRRMAKQGIDLSLDTTADAVVAAADDDTCRELDALFELIRLPATIVAGLDGRHGASNRLGRYWLERVVGQGGGGTVYLAFDEVLERRVAVKVPHPELVADGMDESPVLREARLAARLNHAAIVSVYDVGADGQRCYIVSQYIEGQTLGERLDGAPLPPERAATLTEQIADALAHAHRLGLVHRDLKPGNILLDRQGRPHVTDFGLAIHDGRDRADKPQVAGTIRYMAPEQLPGANGFFDGRTDIWSLGVVLYEMLTGRLPFDGESMQQVMEQIRQRPPRPPRQIDESIPRELERICLKCLAKDASERYATAADLARDLSRWRRGRDGGSAWWAALGVAAALVAGVLATTLVVVASSKDPSEAAIEPPHVRVVPMSPPGIETGPIGDQAPPPRPLDGSAQVPLRLAVRQFDVTHFASEANQGVRLGTMGLASHQAQEDDNVRLRVELNQRAYAYLLAFNPDGSQQLCCPSGDDEQPEQRSVLQFPAGASQYFGLTDGVGQQAFALVASRQPLPSYAQFRSRGGMTPWRPNRDQAEGVWRFDGSGELRGQFARIRGTVRTLSEPPESFKTLCESLVKLPGVETVSVIAFPVRPPSRDVLVAPRARGEEESARPNALTQEEIADGWLLLFDGSSLFGWHADSKANWKVADGAIQVSEGEQGLLLTTTQWGDFVLRADVRTAQGTNSGIFLRTPPQPQDPAGDCYALNIADTGTSEFPTGSFVGRRRATGEHDSDQWQSYEVTARGGQFVVRLDGRTVLDYADPQPLGRGHIGLQFHSGPAQFRNLKLKPLGMEPIFNGKDLTGWKTYPQMRSKFTVTDDGELSVKDGRGQLETTGRYGDFVMQLDCYSNGEQLNSGVFFRCIPGEAMHGYECQIHNGYHDGDRTKPVDCGTGGFYHRQSARAVMVDDFQWFTMTLAADGPHMAAWVNGYPVSDWTDRRGPHDNPRQGLRTGPGTIMLQGHDPTTDLSFRKLRIAETPPR